MIKSKYNDDSDKLAIGKMKNDTGSVTVGKFVRLKSTMYYVFVDDNNEHKKPKGVNRNIIATVGDNKYKHVLLNNKCLRHSSHRIQSEDQGIETYETKKIILSCFGGEIYFQSNEYD